VPLAPIRRPRWPRGVVSRDDEPVGSFEALVGEARATPEGIIAILRLVGHRRRRARRSRRRGVPPARGPDRRADWPQRERAEGPPPLLHGGTPCSRHRADAARADRRSHRERPSHCACDHRPGRSGGWSATPSVPRCSVVECGDGVRLAGPARRVGCSAVPEPSASSLAAVASVSARRGRSGPPCGRR
jgi:hypothetical protein